MTSCKECGKNFDSTKSLHGHLRAHKLTTKLYYEKHWPRQCLLTNRKIVWRDGDTFEEYMSRDFLDQKALDVYFDGFATDEKRELLTEYIRRSIDRNSIGCCEAEWSSLPLSPNIVTFMKYFNYGMEVKRLGSYTRFPFRDLRGFKLPIEKVDPDKFTIIIDSREQQPHEFYSSIVGKCECADYVLAGELFNNVAIERKSIQDFGGTLSSGFDRFKRELDRVRELKRYLIVLVESPIEEIYDHRFYGRVQAPFMFHRMRELIREYSDVSQWVFGGYRWNCTKLIPLFLLCGQACREIDLQLWVELNNGVPKTGPFTKDDLLKLYADSSELPNS